MVEARKREGTEIVHFKGSFLRDCAADGIP